MSIVLDNGRRVEAEFINYRYDVDGKRKGAGVVIAKDREGWGGEQLYVTWDVCQTRDNYELWWAESGHYGLTWKEAIDDAIKRFSHLDGEFA